MRLMQMSRTMARASWASRWRRPGPGRCRSRGPGAWSRCLRAGRCRRRRRGWLEQDLVVAVGAVGGPAHGDPGPVGEQGPLPTGFAQVGGVFAGAGTAAGGFVGGPVDGGLGEVQAHDAVNGRDGFGHQIVEDAGGDPFVAARPQRRVRDRAAQQALGGLATSSPSPTAPGFPRNSPGPAPDGGACPTGGNRAAAATAPPRPPTPHLSLPDPTLA